MGWVSVELMFKVTFLEHNAGQTEQHLKLNASLSWTDVAIIE